MIRPLWLILALMLTPLSTAQAKGLEIGRWHVAIWPEYDDPGTLVIYDGRFADPTAFPAIARLVLPKQATISDACSLSPNGQHFCQLYKIIAGETFDEVELWLPYPNFYLSFHLPPPNLDKEERTFGLVIRTNHPTQRLEVDVQEPLRTREFQLSPTGFTPSTQNGFNHFSYTFDRLAPGEERRFDLRYRKEDARPSVDIKYTRMNDPTSRRSPYELQQRTGILVYGLFGSGLLLVVGLAAWLVGRRRRGEQR